MQSQINSNFKEGSEVFSGKNCHVLSVRQPVPKVGSGGGWRSGCSGRPGGAFPHGHQPQSLARGTVRRSGCSGARPGREQVRAGCRCGSGRRSPRGAGLVPGSLPPLSWSRRRRYRETKAGPPRTRTPPLPASAPPPAQPSARRRPRPEGARRSRGDVAEPAPPRPQ